MRAIILQHDRLWNDKAATLVQLDEWLRHIPAADLLVLPEMFATGYRVDANEVAEAMEGPTMTWMRNTARQHDMAVCGGVAIVENERYLNRLLFVKPDGTVDCYDKRHLFTQAAENRSFTAGTTRVVAEWRGCRFLLQLCYDLRFPVWSRNLDDYDVAIYAASWPETRRAAWDTLLRARALENQCYAIGVNRVGTDGRIHYNGGSCIVDATGQTLVACDDDTQQWREAEIDLAGLAAFRKKITLLNDRDKFTIQ